MITPDEFKEKIKEETVVLPEEHYDPHKDRVRFFAEANTAEKTAIANFRHGLNSGGSAPRKLRIKLDIHWDESLIDELCAMYRKNGWTDVKYSGHDYGLREPQGYWTVTIKM